MGWKIYNHTQPSGNVVFKLAFYHKRTKQLHVLKGKIAKSNKSEALYYQLRRKSLYYKAESVRYIAMQLLPHPLCDMNITRPCSAITRAGAIREYKRARCCIRHVMYLPTGEVIQPPPLSIKAVPTHIAAEHVDWTTLTTNNFKPTKG